MTPTEIRQLRSALGMTQGQTARLVGVDGRTWRRWECDEREMPEPVARLLGLAVALPAVRVALGRMAAAHARHPLPEDWGVRGG